MIGRILIPSIVSEISFVGDLADIEYFLEIDMDRQDRSLGLRGLSKHLTSENCHEDFSNW